MFILVAGGSLGWQVRGQMVGAFQVKSLHKVDVSAGNTALTMRYNIPTVGSIRMLPLPWNLPPLKNRNFQP